MGQQAVTFLTRDNMGRGVSATIAVVLLGTLAVALYRTWQNHNSSVAKRARQVERNKALVESISKLLPDQRDKLTPGAVRVSGRSTTPQVPVAVRVAG